MKWIVLLTLWVSQSAIAHFEIGTYEGVNNLGFNCNIEFVSKDFFPPVKNPLNEIVEVNIHKYGKMILKHQAIINSEENTVLPDGERLVGSVGLKSAALAVEVVMDEEKGAPSHYKIIAHNWKTKKSVIYECKELEFKSTEE